MSCWAESKSRRGGCCEDESCWDAELHGRIAKLKFRKMATLLVASKIMLLLFDQKYPRPYAYLFVWKSLKVDGYITPPLTIGIS